MRDLATYCQTLYDRMQRQQQVIESASRMLEGPATDYKHLMRRLNLRFTIARAESNIARLKAKLNFEGRA